MVFTIETVFFNLKFIINFTFLPQLKPVPLTHITLTTDNLTFVNDVIQSQQNH